MTIRNRVAAALALALLPAVAVAQSLPQLESNLRWVRNLFSPTVIGLICLIAIIVFGLLALMARLSWEMAGRIILGTVVIGSASAIVSALTGFSVT